MSIQVNIQTEKQIKSLCDFIGTPVDFVHQEDMLCGVVMNDNCRILISVFGEPKEPTDEFLLSDEESEFITNILRK